MLVIERWSIFDEEVVRRLELQDGLARANRVNCEAGQVEEFHYEWLSFADSTREAGALSIDLRHRAGSIIRSSGVRERIFLVDRVDAHQAVVPATMADEVYSEFARALLTSDLAFPRPGLHASVTFGGEPSDDEVVPFAIQVFEHGVPHVAAVRGLHVGRKIAAGPRLPELLTSPAELPSLLNLVAQEQLELRQGRFNPVRARERRREAAAELLRQSLL
jgi:hypothetical protein